MDKQMPASTPATERSSNWIRWRRMLDCQFCDRKKTRSSVRWGRGQPRCRLRHETLLALLGVRASNIRLRAILSLVNMTVRAERAGLPYVSRPGWTQQQTGCRVLPLEVRC